MDVNKLQNFVAASRKSNLIPFGLLPAGLDLGWIDDNSGSGGGAPIAQDLTSLVNGVRTAYTLSGTPVDASRVQLVLNGMVVRRTDVTFGFSVVGSTLTTNSAFANGSTLVAYFWTA